MGQIIKVPYVRAGDYQYCHDSGKPLDEWDMKTIYGALKEFEYVVYDYGTGSYEGDGVAIIKQDGKFYQQNLGHCSCYGPWDNINLKKPYDSLDDLLKDCSEQLKDQMLTVLATVRGLETK
jgi:hypothetical protein